MPLILILFTCFVLAADLVAPVAAQSLSAVAQEAGEAKATRQVRQQPFGERLAAAAFERTRHRVVYDPRYIKLSYPMGDVPDNIGVCTDVVIRAYRALGIDLQVLVHRARVGSGDRNIDHRRVRVLRKFLARYGRKLPVTDNPDDYLPGDLVTYHLSNSPSSNSHIAIVSNQRSSSGRPLVIHNIGLGPKLEDWLFGDKITGHFRYTGGSR